jgi:hypothetical protein
LKILFLNIYDDRISRPASAGFVERFPGFDLIGGAHLTGNQQVECAIDQGPVTLLFLSLQ